MPASFETMYLLRPRGTPQEVAKAFIEFTRRRQIITRGRCRIGNVHRGGASMRGLIANKPISKDENIVMMPVDACLHPAVPLQCKPFLDVFPADAQQTYFLSTHYIRNSRVCENALIRYNQFLLGMYMTYLLIGQALSPSQQHGGEFTAYLDFMPRSEGNFDRLEAHLDGWLDKAPVCCEGQSYLAQHFAVSHAEVRAVLLWALCTIYSRVVPITHRPMLQHAFRDTVFAQGFAWQDPGLTLPPEDTSHGGNKDITDPNTNTTGHSPTSEEASRPHLFSEDPISFLCPIIDMCNHSDRSSENVAVMVPDREGETPLLCLRSLRDISKGEELTMNYSDSQTELRVIWGMDPVYS